jgi:hypothetical protein
MKNLKKKNKNNKILNPTKKINKSIFINTLLAPVSIGDKKNPTIASKNQITLLYFLYQ